MRHTNLFKDVSEVKCSMGSENAGKQVIEVFGLWRYSDEIANFTVNEREFIQVYLKITFFFMSLFFSLSLIRFAI